MAATAGSRTGETVIHIFCSSAALREREVRYFYFYSRRAILSNIAQVRSVESSDSFPSLGNVGGNRKDPWVLTSCCCS